MIKTKSFELAEYAKGDPEAKKLAIVNPGRLDTKDYIHLTSLVDMLGQLGFYALSFDPPGIWESPGSIEQYSTTNTLRAIDEIIELYGNRPTIILGHSRGGTHSMLAALKNPHITHMVSIMSHSGPPSTDLPQDDRPVHSERDLPPGNERTATKKHFDLPAAYFEDQQEYDALAGLKKCTKPKLFICGTLDKLVSVEHVQQAYQASAEPKQLIAVESEHDYRLHPEVIKEVNDTIRQFLVDTDAT